ncbi:MAG: hypothetical protein M3065_18850 [Actinomycetota bacterium]|nr:hypothetical protein [Actinomycetota bacterium]
MLYNLGASVTQPHDVTLTVVAATHRCGTCAAWEEEADSGVVDQDVEAARASADLLAEAAPVGQRREVGEVRNKPVTPGGLGEVDHGRVDAS